ncbi:DMT family transporter [Aurantimonas sp. 22II-16-19i]|uniref:DMT family transporter n=1 Tax=Aurantimonas sp. 22II-16-19i TaxID=1317114 RepID=UPI0009F7B016|nr:DMT family transporter [Aurantimonas sp. 22II-16-19i]ORE90594.1 permease, DMT superfamily protein [Aurantimonas sp. 22II-16-19i]
MALQDSFPAPKPAIRNLPYVVLGLSVLALSCGSIMIKAADAPASVIALWRVAVAALVVVPFVLATRQRELATLSRSAVLRCVVAGVFLAVHFLLWTASLKLTTVANSVMLANTSPIWIMIIGLTAGGQKLTRVSGFSLLACMGGAVLVSWQGLALGGETLMGDGLALLAGIALSGYLLLAARAVSEMSTPVYMTLTYPSAAVILAAIALLNGDPLSGFDPQTVLLLCLLGLVSQLIGHGGPSWALKSLTPGFVSQVLLADLILSPIMAMVLFSEYLTVTTVLGCATILIGLLVGASEAALKTETR